MIFFSNSDIATRKSDKNQLDSCFTKIELDSTKIESNSISLEFDSREQKQGFLKILPYFHFLILTSEECFV
ncbi:MAG: hypothetical protein H6Q15_1664 [Bacteroidetes bacterium]|nr:hypothetical protein [Bacteroidota bacterium]